MPLAKGGEPNAHRLLGVMYRQDQGVEEYSEPSETNLSVVNVAERAQFYTTLTECWK